VSLIGSSKTFAELGENVRGMHSELTQRLMALQRSITPDRVHDARTAIRRLLAVLSGYKEFFKVVPRRRYVLALKQMTSKLDALRDADVMQKTLQGFSANAERSTSEERHALIGMTSRNRQQRLAALKADIALGRWTTRIAQLQCSASAALTDIKTPISVQSSVAHILKRCRQRLRSALDYHGRAPRRLHKLRAKVRKMRYILEQATFSHHEKSRLEIARLCSLQESLGALHDAWVLRRAVRARLGDDYAGGDLARKQSRQKKHLLSTYQEDRRALLHVWSESE
jgi:CHAD domain-containing protein